MEWSQWPQGNCLKELSFPIQMFWQTLCIDKMRLLLLLLLRHGVFSYGRVCLRFSLSLFHFLVLLLARCANITSVNRTTLFDANWLTDWLTSEWNPISPCHSIEGGGIGLLFTFLSPLLARHVCIDPVKEFSCFQIDPFNHEREKKNVELLETHPHRRWRSIDRSLARSIADDFLSFAYLDN